MKLYIYIYFFLIITYDFSLLNDPEYKHLIFKNTYFMSISSRSGGKAVLNYFAGFSTIQVVIN
jgi:hypothetical protein